MRTTPEKASGPIDIGNREAMARWCDHFGATAEQIEEAVKAVGDAPDAVREHLLNQGGSAGAG